MASSTNVVPPAIDLAGFSGSDQFYRHGLLRRFVYTQGVATMAEQCGAHWLIDVAASHQANRAMQRICEGFQLWTLQQLDGRSAVVTCRRDTNEAPAVTQELEFTDFPFARLSGGSPGVDRGDDGRVSFSFYVCDNGQGWTMMLKSEY